jgi:hypothetical protein
VVGVTNITVDSHDALDAWTATLILILCVIAPRAWKHLGIANHVFACTCRIQFFCIDVLSRYRHMAKIGWNSWVGWFCDCVVDWLRSILAGIDNQQY